MNFEDIQDKIILNKKNGKLFLVYGMETVETKRFMSTKTNKVINCLDINTSLTNQDFMGDFIEVNSIDDISNYWDILDPDSLPEYLSTLVSSFLVLTEFLNRLKNDLENCNNILQSFRVATESLSDISLPDDTLMFVSVKDSDGNIIEMKPEEYSKIFEIIVELIQENVDIDTEDEQKIKELHDKLEWNVIDFLPSTYNDAHIKINMDLITKEITKAKGDTHGE